MTPAKAPKEITKPEARQIYADVYNEAIDRGLSDRAARQNASKAALNMQKSGRRQ